MCDLAINIASFAHLLKSLVFNVIIDHLALMHIITSKAGQTATRIKRLIETFKCRLIQPALYQSKAYDIK